MSQLENECGWNPLTSSFVNKSCLEKDIFFSRAPPVPVQKQISPSNVHIVVPTIRDLDFLNEWKDFLFEYEFLFIQDGDPNEELKIMSG